MLKTSNNKLYCFSPPVMLATFGIEILLAVWVALRYRLNAIGRVAALLLVLLASFQMAEYQICRGADSAQLWAQFGYLAITVLPVLGLQLGQLIAGSKNNPWLIIAALTAAGFAIGLIAIGDVVPTCQGNYVFFAIGPRYDRLYGTYYLGTLFITMWQALHARVTSKRQAALRWLFAGYLAFLIPSAISITISPAAMRGIPSIMCGFALIFALMLVGGVLPKVVKVRQ